MRWLRHFAPCFLAASLLATARPVPAVDWISAQAPSTCVVQVLRELGWQFEPDARDAIAAGTPCDRATLAEARAAGDLRAGVPDATDRGALRALLEHPASHCAFSLKLGDATRRAVDRLVANEDFRFSGLQLGWIGFGAGGSGRDGWSPIRRLGRGFRPATSPSQAIEGLYRGTVRAECGVGRQAAQYAAQYELHGAEGFDRAFARDEIVIGTFNALRDSGSVLLGTTAGELERDGRARLASHRGRQAFAGLPGFIFHVFDATHLDSINNQAENFVVYDLSPAAAEALRRAQGFEAFNDRARELWELARSLGLDRRISHEGLFSGRFPAWRARLAARERRIVERMEAILAQPFFREFLIYVHPKGVKPVGYHFLRLLDLNPRTPFRIELGLHNLHTTMYRRWIGERVATCGATASSNLDGVDTSSRAVSAAH